MVSRWEIMGDIGKVRRPTPICARKRNRRNRAFIRAYRAALAAARQAWVLMYRIEW